MKTAILASGENFPDALAAGVLVGLAARAAARRAPPLLLTNAASLNPFTSQALADMGIKQVILVGGPNTVNTNVGRHQPTSGGLGITVHRIAGANRQGTAATLAA